MRAPSTPFLLNLCFHAHKLPISRSKPSRWVSAVAYFPGDKGKGIAAEPAPQSSAADLSDQTLRNNVLADFLDRESGQWEPEGMRKLAGECLNVNDETGGKSGPYARLEAAPLGQAIGQRRIAYSTC